MPKRKRRTVMENYSQWLNGDNAKVVAFSLRQGRQ
jgi:hypothetical protein